MKTLLALVMVLSVGATGGAFQQPVTVTAADVKSAIDSLGAFEHAARTAASRTVRRADAAIAVPALVAAVKGHANSYVRYRALVLLAGFGETAAKEQMTAVLPDQNDRLRAVAYAWFEHHPDSQILPRLLAALDTERSEFVRPALTRAVAAFAGDPRAREALLPLVSKGVDYFRGEVIQAIGDYKGVFARDAILTVARLDGPLQEDAVLALGKMGDPAVLPALAELQRSASRERQPAIAAAICLIGTNCATHRSFLVDTLAFASANDGFQPLLRSAAHALASLAARGDRVALDALMAAGIQTKDAAGAPITLGLGLVAIRQPMAVVEALEARPDRDRAVDLLRDAFDSLEEDFGEEQFFVAVRRAYWAAPEGSLRRQVAGALIQKLEF